MRVFLLATLLLASPAIADDTAAPGESAVATPPSPARSADKGTFGIGLILGEPTGVTAKLYLADDQAIQAAAGTALIGGGLQIHADYVFHPVILQTRDSFVMPLYLGPGMRVIDYRAGRADENYLAVGLRAVAGVLIDFKEIPLDAFVEVAGVLEYGFKDGKGVGAALNAGAGARYYF